MLRLPEVKAKDGGLYQQDVIVQVTCPYCWLEHIHKINIDADLKDNRTLTPRHADCGKGSYIVVLE